MGDKLSEKFRSYVFDDTPENGNEDIIGMVNSEVSQDNNEHWIMLSEGVGRKYFYACMELAYNVIKSLEDEGE